MSSLFTCITCHVAFATPEAQRDHYKTDWHRYNLKRKIAELPPVSAESFQERVTTHKNEANIIDQPQQPSYCSTCRKPFASINAYKNHIQSKKHLEITSKAEINPGEVGVMNKKNTEMSKMETTTSSVTKTEKLEKRVLGATASLSKPQKNVATKLDDDDDDGSDWEDMDDEDGEWEEVEGEEGFEVESEPILPNMCLFCSKVNENIEENISHMTTSHSFFIPDIEFLVDLEGLITYLGEKVGFGNVCLWCNEKGRSFYSTKAVQNHMLDKGHCKILHEGYTLAEFADYYDYLSSYPEAEPNPDEEIAENILDNADYELVLPSGAVIGHRSLMKYYKQRLPAEKQVMKSSKTIKKLMRTYKALGWTGTTGEAAVRHAKDISFMRKVQMKQQMKLGMKANKLQHHFRPQVNF